MTLTISSSKRQVLTPDQKRSRVELILKSMMMNHSPKEVANLLFGFLHKHMDQNRVDLLLQDFIKEYDNGNTKDWLRQSLFAYAQAFSLRSKVVVITLMSSHNSAVKQNYHFDTSRLYRSHPISLLYAGRLCGTRLLILYNATCLFLDWIINKQAVGGSFSCQSHIIELSCIKGFACVVTP